MTGNVQISAELTFVRLRGILSYFMDASQKYKIPLAILLAVASRESNMGLSLSAAGTGDHGFGHGIMQVDVRHHPKFTDRHSALDYQANIDYGAGFLAGLIRDFNGEIRPAIAAYNAGQSRVHMAVQAGLDSDHVTTGGDYARDVLHRMETIEAMMGFSKASSLAVYVIPAGLAAFGIYHYANSPSL